MIKVDKPHKPPKSLGRNGPSEITSLCRKYDRCAIDYDNGTKRLPKSKNSIYGSRTVKQALMKAQHKKCCYCEQVFRAPRDLAVEHFRPKDGARQRRKGPERFHPGYYWLVYDWSNLFVSCHECNSTYKQTVFPLSNPTRRARSHHDDVGLEHPLFVHPTLQDPRDHIRFHQDTPVHRSQIGLITIRGVGLRRSGLREARLIELKRLRYFKKVIEGSQKQPRSQVLRDLADEARAFLREAINSEALFSSMAQDFLEGFAL
jgi:uncharacterized protein (TIGR02646 family)